MKFWLRLTGADLTEMTELARVAEAVGFEGVMLPDHIVTPDSIDSRYPYAAPRPGVRPWPPELPWPDPFVAFGAMGAVTTRLRFATYVLVAPMREPLALAKQVATAAVLSGGRVALGVGAGWCREEFEVLGHRFDGRGARFDEMIDVMRAIWKGGWTEHDGDHYAFPRLREDPAPPAPVPIWVGGDGAAAVKRAVERGDGWLGPNYPPEVLASRVSAVRRRVAEAGRDLATFEVMASPMVTDRDALLALGDLGLTGVIVAPTQIATGSVGDAPPVSARVAIERFGDEVLART